jgi:hypothetical protein
MEFGGSSPSLVKFIELITQVGNRICDKTDKHSSRFYNTVKIPYIIHVQDKVKEAVLNNICEGKKSSTSDGENCTDQIQY